MSDAEAVRMVQEDIEGLPQDRNLRSQECPQAKAVEYSLTQEENTPRAGKATPPHPQGTPNPSTSTRKRSGGRIKGKPRRNSSKKARSPASKGQASHPVQRPVMQDPSTGTTVIEAQFVSDKAMMTLFCIPEDFSSYCS